MDKHLQSIPASEFCCLFISNYVQPHTKDESIYTNGFKIALVYSPAQCPHGYFL